MKKIILTSIALIVVSSMAMAQPSSKAIERKAAREAREMKALNEMKADLGTHSFVFYPSSYTMPYQNPVELYNFGYYYLDFYPQSLDVFLPFAINNGPTVEFSSMMTPYSAYKIVHTDGNNYVITARLVNVSNALPMTSIEMQDMNLGVHISVNIMSGAATLTLTPDFSPAVSYQGVLRSNN